MKTERQNAVNKFVFVVRLVFISILIIYGLLSATMFTSIQRKDEQRCTKYLYGKVMTVIINTNKNKRKTYRATVQFELDGKTITEEGTSYSRLTKGESVKVMYDPDDHSKYYVPAIYYSSETFMIQGVTFISLGILFLILTLKNKRRSD